MGRTVSKATSYKTLIISVLATSNKTLTISNYQRRLGRCRAIWSTITQSELDFGLDFQVEHLQTLNLFPFRSAAVLVQEYLAHKKPPPPLGPPWGPKHRATVGS